MILIGIGMLIVAGGQLMNSLMSTAELAKLNRQDADVAKIFERIDLYNKIFPLFSCGGLVLVLIGAVGLVRTPQPSPAGVLAVVGLCACALVLLVEVALWFMHIADDDSKLLQKLYGIKAIWVIDAMMTAATVILLVLAVHLAMRRAGQGGALALAIITCVLAGLVVMWLAYIQVAQPKLRFRLEHPWQWMTFTHLPRIARDVLLGVTGLVGAAQIRRARV
jgi:hypothetical protein